MIKINYKKVLYHFFLTIYLFLSIFLPNITKYPIRNIMIFLDIAIIGYYFIKEKKIIISKSILSLFYGFIPFFLYFAVIQIIRFLSGNIYHTSYYTETLLSITLVFIYVFIVCLTMSILIKLFKLDAYEICNIYIYTGALQMICVVLSYIFPSIRSYFLGTILNNSQSEVIINAVKNNLSFRCYGFADNLFDALGYISSILITLSFAYGIEKRKKSYVVLSFAMLIIPLLNTRTGLILSLVGMLIVIFNYFEFKKVLKYLLIVLTAAIIFAFGFKYLPEQTQYFIIRGINETNLLLNGQVTSTYSEIFGKDIVFPDDIIFGAGTPPEWITNYSGIDSGYIQCLWRFGLIGTLLIFVGYLRLYLKLYSITNNKFNHSISLALIAIFFVYLFKLFSINNYGSVMLIFGLPICLILNSKNLKETSNSNKNKRFKIAL